MIPLLRYFSLAAALALSATSALAVTHKPAADPSDEPDPVLVVAPPEGIPRTHAASVLVTDANIASTLYEKNADEQRPPASTQKLLTALLVVESGNLDKQVTVAASDTQVEPVRLNFKPGEVYTRRDLLEVLLVHSTNDVARCLARDNAGSLDAFAAKMNAKAAALGMTHSHFVNPNGLPAPGQYSTARDMAKLARAVYQSATIRGIVAEKSVFFRFNNGKIREFANTNHVLRGYPYCNGMKTGYTEAAKHCLISSGKNNGREVIVVVLGDDQRVWQDSCSLLAWGLSL
jgi:D-alanyl-D-alanine carboxypeptidase (penicillin-binding protein 5/6)